MMLASFSAGAKTLVIDGVRSPRQDNQLRVVLAMNDKPRFTWGYKSRQQRLWLQIKSAILAPNLTLSTIDHPILTATPSVKEKKRLLIARFDVIRQVQPKVFYLPPTGGYGHRLVLDFKLDKTNLPDRLPGQPKSQITIVLDPGHGGKDPGALGASGGHAYPEKVVVLDIAVRLKKALDQHSDLKIILTRTSDIYVELPARVRHAREVKADFFISIHADANSDPLAQGASVFIRPDNIDGHTETLGWLVNQEGHGIPDSMAEVDAARMDVLHNNLEIHAGLFAAVKLANAILDQLKGVTLLHGGDIRRGDFEVIRALDIPSVLIETGFISNPEEGRKLRSAKHRQMLARHLARALIDFIRQQSNSPDGWVLQPRLEQTPSSNNKTPEI